MNCSKCGTINNEGAKFCVKCGNPMEVANNVGVQGNINPADGSVSQPPLPTATQVSQPTPMEVNPSAKFAVPTAPSLNVFSYIIASLIKPSKAFKDNEKAFDFFSKPAIIALLVPIIAILSTIVQTLIVEIKLKFSYFKIGDFLIVLLKEYAIYLAVIFGIALIFYLGSLVLKKEIKYSKILTIVSTALLPYFICSFVLSPLLSLVWLVLGILISYIGAIYSISIFRELVDSELQESGEKKIYFYTACFGAIAIIIYLLLTNVSGLSAIISLF